MVIPSQVRRGSDSITGGSGADLFYATAGTDTLNGGGGTNTISFINATVGNDY